MPHPSEISSKKPYRRTTNANAKIYRPILALLMTEPLLDGDDSYLRNSSMGMNWVKVCWQFAHGLSVNLCVFGWSAGWADKRVKVEGAMLEVQSVSRVLRRILRAFHRLKGRYLAMHIANDYCTWR